MWRFASLSSRISSNRLWIVICSRQSRRLLRQNIAKSDRTRYSSVLPSGGVFLIESGAKRLVIFVSLAPEHNLLCICTVFQCVAFLACHRHSPHQGRGLAFEARHRALTHN